MARTKASVGAKVAAGKSSKARCSVAPPAITAGPSGSSSKSSRNYSGGNSVCPRETPKWQKPITNFIISRHNSNKDSDDSDCDETVKPKVKRNVIESDDEEHEEKPKNRELDETIELEPLNGEDSHKIEEYYSKNGENYNQNDNNSTQSDDNQNNNGKIEENNNGEVKRVKGKGIGKKTKGKENISTNVERKREREDDIDQVSKRVRVE